MNAAPAETAREDIARADVVLVGPAPPLRGGIAAHTARLAEALRADGLRCGVVSYRRLYPSFAFPGRSQRCAAPAPGVGLELLDVLSPPSWAAARRLLAASRATVVLQWWHPVVAPALLTATHGLERERVVALVHNVLPHERLPGAGALARGVLAGAGRIVCHGVREAEAVRRLVGPAAEVRTVALPYLLPPALADDRTAAPLPGATPGLRWAVAAGHVRAYKGIDVLLEAWIAARRPPEARLAVVGEWYLRGAERRRVLGLAASDPSITLIDRYVEDRELARWLSCAEVLVAAHRRASQSGVVPLAAAVGLRCIVSDAGDLARQAGPGADVVRAGDAGALALALERVFARPRPAAVCGGDPLAARVAADWRRVVEAIPIGLRPSTGVSSEHH